MCAFGLTMAKYMG